MNRDPQCLHPPVETGGWNRAKSAFADSTEDSDPVREGGLRAVPAAGFNRRIPRLPTFRRRPSVWLCVLVLFLAGCNREGTQPNGSTQKTLTIGSKRFTESYILGEILRQVADGSGEVKATHKQGLGSTGIVFQALKTGSIDLYPEYTGTIDQELLKNKQPSDLPTLNRQLAPLGLGVAVPLGFRDNYALAMRDEQAQRLGIRTISDLGRHTDLKLGLSPEFLKRADGWPGLKEAYHLSFSEPRGLEHGLAYEAIAGGQIDVMDIYTTDAKLDKYKLRVLEDDRKFFPHYDAVLLYRLDLPQRLPRTWAALQKLEGTISEKQMITMNADAELRHEAFADIAAAFLNGRKKS